MRLLCIMALGALCAAGCDEAPAPLPRPQPLASCLPFEPDTVTLTGTVARLTFPGRPNFQDTLAGDEPEPGYYLTLDSLLCTRGPWVGQEWPPRDSIRLVQLVLDSSGYARLRPDLGRRITLVGTAFPAHTGHHHAPILMDVVWPRHE